MNNRLFAPELFRYLVELAAVLEAAAETRTAEQVIHVSRFASGSTSELYGEALLLLPAILEKPGVRLGEPDKARLRDIIEAIEREFRVICGG
jgi:hypothetical protein